MKKVIGSSLFNSAFNMFFAIFVLSIFITEVVSYGQSCELNKLGQCNQNEVCSQNSSSSTSTCQCLPNYFHYEPTKSCVRNPPEPFHSSSNAGLIAGLVFLFLLIIVTVVVGFLHYKYHILSEFRRRFLMWREARRGGHAYEVEIDDDNPIV